MNDVRRMAHGMGGRLVGEGIAGERIPVVAHAGVAVLLVAYVFCVVHNEWGLFFNIVLGLTTLVASLLRLEFGLAIVPLGLLNPYRLGETGTNLIVSELLLLIVFSVWFVGALSFNKRLEFPRALLIPALLVVAASAVSIFSAAYRMPAVLQVVRYVEIMLILFIMVHQTVRSESNIRLIVGAILLGGLIASLVGIGQFLFGEEGTRGTGRVYGLLGGGYGCGVAVTVILALTTALSAGSKRLRLLAGITAPVAGLALLLSQTRTWIAALAVALFVLLIQTQSHLRRRILIVTGSIVGFIGMLIATDAFGLAQRNLFQAALGGAFRWQVSAGQRSMEDLSLLMRFGAWSHALGVFTQNPLFGIGVANLRFTSYLTGTLGSPLDPDAGFVDNQYIQFFAEAGLIAGIAWIVYLGAALVTGRRAVRLATGGPLGGVALGLSGAILVVALGSFFWVVTPSHELFSLLVLMIALLASVVRLLKPVE
ncbi:MAG: O-antigen ligase family protein [Bacteroidota bacterium]